jgi:hypothetical protein
MSKFKRASSGGMFVLVLGLLAFVLLADLALAWFFANIWLDDVFPGITTWEWFKIIIATLLVVGGASRTSNS